MALDINRAMAAFERGQRESRAARQYVDRALSDLPFSSSEVWARIRDMSSRIGTRQEWPLAYIARWAIDELTAEWAGASVSLARRPSMTRVTREDIAGSGHLQDYLAAYGGVGRDILSDLVTITVAEARAWGLYEDHGCECDMHHGEDA